MPQPWVTETLMSYINVQPLHHHSLIISVTDETERRGLRITKVVVILCGGRGEGAMENGNWIWDVLGTKGLDVT